MSHYIVVVLVICFLFRKPLGRWLAKRFPDRAKRQRVLGTIIAAFLLVIGVRLLALLW